MHVQSCCFANLNLLLFCRSCCHRRRRRRCLSFLLHSRIGRWLAFWPPPLSVQLITLLEEPELKSILSCLFVGLQDKASRRQGSKARTIPAIWCPRNTSGECCGSCKARRQCDFSALVISLCEWQKMKFLLGSDRPNVCKIMDVSNSLVSKEIEFSLRGTLHLHFAVFHNLFFIFMFISK